MSLREQKKVRVRSDILAAANTLIARKGYQSTTMREIAVAANLSYQTLYNYFPSKAQIVQAMLTDADNAGTQFAAIIAGSDGLVAKLNQIIKRYFDRVAHRQRALWREIVLEVIANAPEYLALQAFEASGINVLRTLLRDAQQTGELDPYVDAELLAHTLYAIADFAFVRFVLEPNPSKVVALKTLRNQVDLLVQPYLRNG
jgi:AcrR family transcriptional regulator